MTTQPEALRLAEALEDAWRGVEMDEVDCQAAAELRRLHAVNAELLEALIHIGFAAMDITCERKTIRDAARAAIAKAEGQA
jgi:hypothetical protein